MTAEIGASVTPLSAARMLGIEPGRSPGNAEAIDPSLARAELIAARIDRLPFSRWHARILTSISLAHLFDAFGFMSIAFVLPVLIQHWALTTSQAGLLVSAGYAGQFIGAIAIGWTAERFGRRRALSWTLSGMAVLSLACALAASFAIFTGMRFLQGIALGGEGPVAATYINEISPRVLRGRMVFILQLTVGIGTLLTGVVALWLVPRFGWQSMFLVGTLPLLLGLLLRWIVPESPRWMAHHQFESEAERTTDDIERRVARGAQLMPAPPTLHRLPATRTESHLRTLISPRYLRRTLSVWVIMVFMSLAQYGLISWLPSLYTMVYRQPVQKALQYSVALGVAGILSSTLGFFLIDRIGRRRTFLLGFLGSALPLLWLGLVGVGNDAFFLMILSSVSVFFGVLVMSGVYVYAPEVYPTHIRALGAGVGTSWIRVGAIISPALIGWLLGRTGVATVFCCLAGAALVGALGTYLLVIETRGLSLEEIAES